MHVLETHCIEKNHVKFARKYVKTIATNFLLLKKHEKLHWHVRPNMLVMCKMPKLSGNVDLYGNLIQL